MDVLALETARIEVAAEMKETERDFEKLRVRRSRLEAILTNLTALLNEGAEQPSQDGVTEAGSARATVHAIDKPKFQTPKLWMLVRDAFPRTGGTLSVPEIHKLMSANGAIGPDPDKIRVAMRRRPDIFHNRSGRYGLRAPVVRQEDSDSNAKEATEVAS